MLWKIKKNHDIFDKDSTPYKGMEVLISKLPVSITVLRQVWHWVKLEFDYRYTVGLLKSSRLVESKIDLVSKIIFKRKISYKTGVGGIFA